MIRCPRCGHGINSHAADAGCTADAFNGCGCRVDPNTIATAAVHTALFGELTPTPGT